MPAAGVLAQTAQTADNPETEAPAPEPIPLDEVPVRAQAVRAKLEALDPGDADRETLERIGPQIAGMLGHVESVLARTRLALKGVPNVRTLQEIELELKETLERLQPWDDELDGHLGDLRAALEKLDAVSAAWDATAELARQESAGATTTTRIAAVRRGIDETRTKLVERRDRIAAVRDRLVDPGSSLTASVEDVQSRIEARIQGIFGVDRPPIWSPQLRESLREEWQAGGSLVRQRLQEVRDYANEQAPRVGFQILLFVALLVGLRSLRNRGRARAEDDADLRGAEEVLELPWAIALLIAILLTSQVHPLAPRGAGLFAGSLGAVAILAIGLRFLVPAMAPLAWAFAIFYLVNQGRSLLGTMPTVERIVYQVELLGALGLLLWLLRPRRLAEIPAQLRATPFLKLLGGAMRVAVAVLALAIVADLAGWGDLASLLGNAVLRGGWLALMVFVFLKIVQSLAAFALLLWPLRLLRAVSQHRPLVRRRLDRTLSVLAVGLWATFVSGQLGLLGPALAGIRGVLGAGISVGALSVSVSDLLAFAITVWLSFVLARLVNFILEEDVFARLRTARGVPYAVAGLVRYTLIFLGFLVGLAAAGVELTKLTVIAGGLGVGIGFGLQNVVNNFVSGLILLFERPVQVGDAVQLPDIWGEIKRIGIRASVIRTFDGAEVIVPNGMLISDRVTNWTLSDRRRRVEIDVGVAYGTPAQSVIDLLIGVAKADPSVLSDPPPNAFFMRFGDSALEFKLRTWVNFDDGYAIRSGLTVAIQEALEQAGIGVPFPQRDLHLKSVSQDVASELGAGSGPAPRPRAVPAAGSGDSS